jgi:hypothetical protein
MLEVETYIVELIDQLGKMRSPITLGLQLANSLFGKKDLRGYAQTKKRTRTYLLNPDNRRADLY